MIGKMLFWLDMYIRQTKTSIEQEQAYTIRRLVFIDEQSVSKDEEFDGLDDQAIHFLVWSDDSNTQPEQAVGTARLRFVNEWAKLERIAVLQSARNLGLGAALVNACLARAKENKIYQFTLGAQTYALRFYEKLGFHAVGAEFMDANIPHFKMIRQDTL